MKEEYILDEKDENQNEEEIEVLQKGVQTKSINWFILMIIFACLDGLFLLLLLIFIFASIKAMIWICQKKRRRKRKDKKGRRKKKERRRKIKRNEKKND